MSQPSATSEPYTFSPAELDRLVAFKQAVAAGFYNEGFTAETPAPSPSTKPQDEPDQTN